MPITLVGGSDLDVSRIDASSIRIGPGQAGLTGSGNLVLADLNGDGHLDARGLFRPDAAGLSAASTEACLSLDRGAGAVRSCVPLGGLFTE